MSISINTEKCSLCICYSDDNEKIYQNIPLLCFSSFVFIIENQFFNFT